MDESRKQQFIRLYPFEYDDTKSGRILQTGKVGGVFISRLSIKPEVITGNLYHKKTNIILFVASGKVLFIFKQINTGQTKEIILEPGMGIVHVPPCVVITSKNIDREVSVVFFFSNRPFRSGDDYEYVVLR